MAKDRDWLATQHQQKNKTPRFLQILAELRHEKGRQAEDKAKQAKEIMQLLLDELGVECSDLAFIPSPETENKNCYWKVIIHVADYKLIEVHCFVDHWVVMEPDGVHCDIFSDLELTLQAIAKKWMKLEAEHVTETEHKSPAVKPVLELGNVARVHA